MMMVARPSSTQTNSSYFFVHSEIVTCTYMQVEWFNRIMLLGWMDWWVNGWMNELFSTNQTIPSFLEVDDFIIRTTWRKLLSFLGNLVPLLWESGVCGGSSFSFGCIWRKVFVVKKQRNVVIASILLRHLFKDVLPSFQGHELSLLFIS